MLYLLGTEMDFEVTKLRTGFVFNNPNESSACGCGESVELQPADLLESRVIHVAPYRGVDLVFVPDGAVGETELSPDDALAFSRAQIPDPSADPVGSFHRKLLRLGTGDLPPVASGVQDVARAILFPGCRH
jgi:hypothetical protein